MNDMPDHIPDDAIRKKLQEYREAPDDNLWEKIQQDMTRDFSLRLHEYREEPDDTVWEGVSNALRVQRQYAALERTAHLLTALSFIFLLSTFYFERRASVSSISAPQSGQVRSSKEAEIAEPAIIRPNADTTETHELRDEIARAYSNSAPDVPGDENDLPDNDGQMNARQGSARERKANVEPEKIVAVVLPEPPLESVNSDTSIAGAQVIDTARVRLQEPIDVDSTKLSRGIPGDTIKTVLAKKKPAPRTKKRLRLAGLYFLAMPTLGYQQIKPVPDDDIFVESLERVATFSPKRLGIRAEIGWEKKISPKLTFHAGVLYFQRRQTIAYRYHDSEHFVVKPLDTDSLVYDVVPESMRSTFEYELKNGGVIAGINYEISGGRVTQRAGIAAEIHRSFLSSGQEGGADPRSFLFGDLYYRVTWKLNSRLDLIFQPTVNYSLHLDERVAAPFYVKPYGLGLNFGLYYFINGR